MANFTTQIRNICQNLSGYEDHGEILIQGVLTKLTPDFCITLSMQKIFDFAFPIFDATFAGSNEGIYSWNFPTLDQTGYKNILERKILRHYYMREIGFETVAQFKLHLNTKMNEIMPYYNQLYLAQEKLYDEAIDYLTDVDYTDTLDIGEKQDNEMYSKNAYSDVEDKSRTGTMKQTKNGDEKNTKNGTKTNTTAGHEKNVMVDKYSDTPQGAGGYGANNMDNGWLTSMRRTENDITHPDGGITNTESFTNYEDKKSFVNRYDKTEFGDYNASTGHYINGIRDYTERDYGERSENRNKVFGSRHDLRTIKGKRNNITYSKMLKEYKENMSNIDVLVIKELGDLFFGLWE